ncbi:MAG TPA: cytochrome b/b6 domain-containing protein [Thiotrichales bacterium]|nr:cytochrome b/b6 domain-containing protein [Thiotrichales bacterium]
MNAPIPPRKTPPAIQLLPVWRPWLRLAHLLVGLSTLLLAATGWLVAGSPSLAEGAADLHQLAAAALVAGLAIRLLLFFTGDLTERLDALVPKRGELRIIGATARFYLALGRAPLPRWYAHNPLWKLPYLLLYIALAVEAASGLLRTEHPILWGFYLPNVHAWWFPVILWIVAGHIVAVVLHDLKGRTADVSAIIHGSRLFHVDRSALQQPVEQFVPPDLPTGC